jgi:Leucine-rich repeat (LRR) protein
VNKSFLAAIPIALVSLLKSRGSKSKIEMNGGVLCANIYGYEDLINLLHFTPPETLKQIKVLFINDYHTTWLPNDIFDLENLEELYITGQPIKELPDNISDFKNLISLGAMDADLEKIPDTLFDIENLDFVKLGGNNIKELPENTWKFQGFDLFLWGNPILYPSDRKIMEWDAKGFWGTEELLKTKHSDPKARKPTSELRRF